ncbi:Histone-lysine N-methyltransferase (Ash1) [Penicillium riverlandense]|uniref:Histone-lysine N-methyltransferase (Ash1) n=1 Tax=Penicillium riverlandense TaxID=1903569 RepID=UPI002548869C|nr:Histone-lysine N-methyltransferase (Ash1) [Penicillium riverlandense]KAJ5819815.1 Histone-lysine N-methyltransferase (Ash1) [Penicillium riverlandense]
MPVRPSSRSGASAAILPDAHTIDPIDDTMNLDVPEQLLTPEHSRSETSSNNENALPDEKPARRTSTRTKRVSLRAAEALVNTPAPSDKSTPTPSEAYVDSLAKAKRSKSSLRHSIAVMESSLWKVAPDEDDTAMAPATPISSSSQELPPDEGASSLQQRTLRKRVEKALAKEEGPTRTKAAPSRRHSMRRSSRLSVLASDLVGRASSVLGKRSREMGELGKDLGRRASLRPRNAAPLKEEPAPEPSVKKRRVSESDLSKLQSKDAPPSEEPAAPTVPRYKPKRWLSHGLYTGQEPSDSPPKQRRSKNSKKTGTGPMQRKVLPMPMFAGSRLLKTGRDFQLPFDVFSPLPPGQPKPDEWRKTNKNVFVGDAASFWKVNKNLELSKCMCDEDTGCDENCQNRYMFYECDNGNCRLGPECGNRSFAELKKRTKAGGKYNVGVEVIKTPDRGYGVRSNRSFEPNQIIVEYTGEIITQFECERRMRNVYKNNEVGRPLFDRGPVADASLQCYYLMYFDQNMIIDATRGSIARFVNHSCEPNCRMEKWTVAGKPRMALFAGDHGIMTGEELSYDYNFDPYSNKNVQQCRCGASNCRGILGPRPKDKDRVKELADKPLKKAKKVAGTKRKIADAVDSAPSRGGKRRKLLTGVKKAIKKTRRGKAAKETTATSKTTGRGRVAAKNVKLPTVKATSRVKATVRGPRKNAAAAAKATLASPTKLKRPSPETKKKIIAAASRGSKGGRPKKTTGVTSPRKPAAKSPAKSPVNNKVTKTTAAKASSPVKGKGWRKGVKSAARSVVRSVKEARK